MHELARDRPWLVQPVVEREDVLYVARLARDVAGPLGFDPRGLAELSIVVMELGMNVLKHAGVGTLGLGTMNDDVRGVGVVVEAIDDAPPIADLTRALQDGCDGHGPIDPERVFGRGGLGTGLGAVLRLTDRFEHQPHPPGKRIRVVRFACSPSARGVP